MHWDGEPMGALFEVLDRFAGDRGWLVSRQLRSENGGAMLVDLVVALGIGDRLTGRLVLDEGFFVRLRTEPEDQQVASKLAVLEDLLQRSLEALVAP